MRSDTDCVLPVRYHGYDYTDFAVQPLKIQSGFLFRRRKGEGESRSDSAKSMARLRQRAVFWGCGGGAPGVLPPMERAVCAYSVAHRRGIAIPGRFAPANRAASSNPPRLLCRRQRFGGFPKRNEADGSFEPSAPSYDCFRERRGRNGIRQSSLHAHPTPRYPQSQHIPPRVYNLFTLTRYKKRLIAQPLLQINLIIRLESHSFLLP